MKSYTFHVTIPGTGRVWRKIELRGDQTLHDLHFAIQDAYEFDADHLYSFFMSNKFWDSSTVYSVRSFDPGFAFEDEDEEEGGGSMTTTLDSLELSKGQVFAYLFDFGDEWRFRIKVHAINQNAPTDVSYPRLIESVGEAPPQYPDWDEAWIDELWDDEDWEEDEEEEE